MTSEESLKISSWIITARVKKWWALPGVKKGVG
jgi:hypothetical protein